MFTTYCISRTAAIHSHGEIRFGPPFIYRFSVIFDFISKVKMKMMVYNYKIGHFFRFPVIKSYRFKISEI